MALALAAARQPPIMVVSTTLSGGTPPAAKHRRHGGHQEELDDSRLGERQIRGGNVANTGQLTTAANCSHPKINTSYPVVVGGHPTWRVDARHRFHSLTV